MSQKLVPEVKAKWLAKLRSGEIEQGIGYLHNAETGRMCCLGVLTKLYIEDTGNNARQLLAADSCQPARYAYGNNPNHIFAPAEVMEWAFGSEYISIDKTCPRGDIQVYDHAGYEVKCLSQLNDDDKFSFTDIADIIEEQL